MSVNFRRLLFDSLFLAYSLALVLYTLLLWGASNLTAQESAVKLIGTIMWALLGVFVVSVLTIVTLDRMHISTLGEILFATHSRKRELHKISFFKSFWGLHLLGTFLLTLFVSLRVTEFSLFELTDADGIQGALRLYRGLTHANLALLPTATVQVVQTIFIAFLATVLAVPPAFALSFLSARNVMNNATGFIVYMALRTFMNIIRSVEPLIWALIFTVWVGVGPFAGMLALMIHSVASLAKQFSEIIEDVHEGPLEAIRSTGATPLQVVWFAIVPQTLLPFVSFVIYRWDTNLRMATVIGLVGGGGIGTLLIQYQGQAMWPEVGCIIIVIALAVWVMDLATAHIREALR
jgi:phosphonate transport system permease protein